MPIRQLVHRGACRKIGGVLTSAVQHNDQWEGSPGGGSGRDVEVIVPGSSGTDMPYPATSARTDPMVSRSVGGFDNAYQGVLLTIHGQPACVAPGRERPNDGRAGAWVRCPIGLRRGHVAAVRSKSVLFPDLGFRCCLAGLKVTDFLAVAAGLAARDVATSVARGAESLILL
jgi:hypothetical protein